MAGRRLHGEGRQGDHGLRPGSARPDARPPSCGAVVPDPGAFQDTGVVDDTWSQAGRPPPGSPGSAGEAQAGVFRPDRPLVPRAAEAVRLRRAARRPGEATWVLQHGIHRAPLAGARRGSTRLGRTALAAAELRTLAPGLSR